MREPIRQILTKICIFAVCVLFLWHGSMAVHAENGEAGEIQIQLKDLKTNGSDRKKVPVWLYWVGTVDKYGRPEFDREWEIPEYPQNSALLDETAKKLAGMIKGKPAMEGRTDAEGKICFQNVEKGIYLAVIPEQNDYGKVAPFLIHLPYYEEVNGKMEGPVYQVEAEPKASPYEKPAPEKPGPGEKDPESPSELPKPSESQNLPAQSKSAKTGDTAKTESYLLTAVTAALFCGAIIVKRRKHS